MQGRFDIVRHDHSVAVRLGSGDLLPVRQIIGVGRNYAAHAHEQDVDVPERPMLFTKNPASATLHGDVIVLPEICADREQVDYEGELAVIIGAACKDVPEADALRGVEAGGCLLGYCVANDVSARWWQKQGSGGQFYRGKSFDSFCPMGPFVTPASLIDDPQSLHVTTTLNGEVVQSAPTSQMMFSVAALVSELSAGTTLLPGTVILTDTPSGVGMAQDPPRFLRAGDEVRISIGTDDAPESLGTLANTVV